MKNFAYLLLAPVILFFLSFPAFAFKVSPKSGTTTASAVGPTDNLNVVNKSTVFVDTNGNNVTIGGFVGGTSGQRLSIVVIDATNNAILEHAEGTGNQDIYLSGSADETITAGYGGWLLVCNGTHWYEESIDVGGAGAAPVGAHYLVDLADGTLTAEVVVSANGKALVTAANYAAMKVLTGWYTATGDLDTDLQTLAGPTPWRMFHSDAADPFITEIVLGADGTFLESNGPAAAPAFRALVDGDIPTTLTLETISGSPVITNGVAIGTDDTNHLIDEATNGAGSATLYIGNETILASGDIDNSVQAYHAALASIVGLVEADVSIIEQTGADAYNVVTSGGANYFLGSNAGNDALEFKTPQAAMTAMLGASYDTSGEFDTLFTGKQDADAQLTALALFDAAEITQLATIGAATISAAQWLILGSGKFDAGAAPDGDNDIDEGYVVGSPWLDVTNDKAWKCLDNTDGAAVWKEDSDFNSAVGGTDYDKPGTIPTAARKQKAPATLTVNDTTPPITASESFITANTNDTTITMLDGGTAGDRRTIKVNDTKTTWDLTGTNLKGFWDNDLTTDAGDIVKGWFDGTNWYLDFTNHDTIPLKEWALPGGADSLSDDTYAGITISGRNGGEEIQQW